MNAELILAIDPGKTSGVASCFFGGGEIVSFTAFELDQQQTCDYVWGCVTGVGYPINIVAERFVIGPNTLKMSRGGAHCAIGIIETARWMARRHQASFKLQDPATAKRMCSNDLLRKAGFWTPALHGHANDAARHLVVALVERGWYSPFL